MAETHGQTAADERTNAKVMTQWRKLQELKRALIKEGIVNGDATPQQVLDAVRAQVPPGLF